jgi:eukaryotic-like serine/threonine-protein kinase
MDAPGLYHRSSSGTGSEEFLTEGVAAFGLSQDGKLLTYFTSNRETGDDTYILPMTGDRTPTPFLKTKFHEYENQLSPDGKWMTYVSEESGRPEVFVESFPRSDQRVQISTPVSRTRCFPCIASCCIRRTAMHQRAMASDSW